MTTFSWHHGHTRRHRQDTAVTPGTGPATEPFWEVLSLGVLTLIFGAAVLIWPGQTLRLLGALVGAWLIVAGAMRVASAFSRHREAGQRLLSAAIGAILVVGGIACLRNAAGGVLVLATVIGLAWLLIGFAELAVGFISPGPARRWMAVLGAISIAVGLAFVLWPGLSLGALVLLTGISALIIGTGEVAFAIQLRRSIRAAAA